MLAQWRGVDLAPIEKARALTARSPGQLMPGLMADLQLDRRHAEAEVTRLWDQALAADITAHAKPDGLRNGTLFVTVDNNVWLSEIVRYRRREILDRLQTAFGREVIKKVAYRVG